MLNMHLAILTSGNFSKFHIRSLKKKKKSPQASAALLASTAKFVPPIPASHQARPSGMSPALYWLLQFSPRTGSHTYTPPGTVPQQPSMLHTTFFLWQFFYLLQDHKMFVVSFPNVLFKLEDALPQPPSKRNSNAHHATHSPT